MNAHRALAIPVGLTPHFEFGSPGDWKKTAGIVPKSQPLSVEDSGSAGLAPWAVFQILLKAAALCREPPTWKNLLVRLPPRLETIMNRALPGAVVAPRGRCLRREAVLRLVLSQPLASTRKARPYLRELFVTSPTDRPNSPATAL